ncbi:tripartite tricarboxylate transporter substrate binding protein [Candidimonas nitroreducens]|uniref:Tripartite tricarboxylate transporter receptor protein n=1 Tax=Candidimonas nitroreducens TaxID=683354 RepID=A0A225MU62_9BURK|nr:tripartite tricarboxylate transporter substrate binding protein [Candidimonas nitroreducens]OWT64003.1 tripartite tricarboxylate transporter receptor protein [Candidimonas nitroreducens]
MRKLILLSLAAFFSVLCLRNAVAEPQQPGRDTQFIVPAGPGGSLDIVARKLQELLLKKKLVSSFVVLNKPGAGAQLALNVLDQNLGNPNFLMTLPTAIINNSYLGVIKTTYKNYTPIAMLLDGYIGVLVRSDSPFKTAKDLIDQLKKDPDSLNIAIAASLGNDIHVGVAKALMLAGVDISKLTFVPFKSSGVSITNLIGGNVDVVGATTPTIIPALQTGKVRVLAIGSPERLKGPLSNVPTWKELGIDTITSSPQGVLAPKGITPEQVKFWESNFRQVTETQEWHDFLEQNQWAPRFMGASQTVDMLASETKSIEEVLDKLHLKKQ